LINKDRRTGNEVALIPELCQLTGLTDAMRADFRLMKDLAGILHTNAEAKIKEIKKQKLWHLQFNENPRELEGFKYNAGKLLMGPTASGNPNTFDIEQNMRDIDRKI
jgi:hypothetical protein